MTAVILDNITKTFGDTSVIKGISLTIQKGEFVS
ncbi:MAG: amino acid ABC transporter ATP-binding protein, partial [Oxalobacteraceae bacterium]